MMSHRQVPYKNENLVKENLVKFLAFLKFVVKFMVSRKFRDQSMIFKS